MPIELLEPELINKLYRLDYHAGARVRYFEKDAAFRWLVGNLHEAVGTLFHIPNHSLLLMLMVYRKPYGDGGALIAVLYQGTLYYVS